MIVGGDACAGITAPRIVAPVAPNAKGTHAKTDVRPQFLDQLMTGLYKAIGVLSAPVVDAQRLLKIESCQVAGRDRKSTRLNSSHVRISYAVFCLKKKKKYGKRRGLLPER